MPWEKVNYNKLHKATCCCNKTNLTILKEFLILNEIESYRKPSWIGTNIKRFLENKGIAAGNTYIHLKMKIPTIIDHCRMYKTKKSDILIVSHSYLPVELIKEEFDNWNNGDFKLSIFGCENNTNLLVITLKNVEVKF